MMLQVEDGRLDLFHRQGERTAELAIDDGESPFVGSVKLTPAELHQLAYHALALANEIRSVRQSEDSRG